jgi:hypothetical protein
MGQPRANGRNECWATRGAGSLSTEKKSQSANVTLVATGAGGNEIDGRPLLLDRGRLARDGARLQPLSQRGCQLVSMASPARAIDPLRRQAGPN